MYFPSIGTLPTWLRDGHSQTIVPAIWSTRHQRSSSCLVRERWNTPDGDFIDVDRLHGLTPDSPLLVLFHGLEGSSSSHYVKAFAEFTQGQGLSFAVPHFRGCSGEVNHAPRAYHSGDHLEIDWILKKFKSERRHRSLLAAGVSLGGNALMRWAGEHSQSAENVTTAIAAVSAPLDLAAAGRAIDLGLNRQIYTRMFLRTMKPKALSKLQQYPGLFDRRQLMAAKTLYEFDNVFTAPLHGFANTEDYWRRASAKPMLGEVRVPALLVNAQNDPFIPKNSLPQLSDVTTDFVTLWQPAHGGHVGFPASSRQSPWGMNISAMPDAVGGWLMGHTCFSANQTTGEALRG